MFFNLLILLIFDRDEFDWPTAFKIGAIPPFHANQALCIIDQGVLSHA